MKHDLVTETFLKLISIDSPSGNEEALRSYIEDCLEQLGASIKTDAFGNLSGFFPGSQGKESAPALMFCCHMDTVPSAVGVTPIFHEDGSITGDGTALGADDKAGIAAVLVALKQLHSVTHPPVIVVFTREEELGVNGSAHLQYDQYGAIQAAYVPDTAAPPGTAITAGAGKTTITVTFTGKSAHAGTFPEAGISAIMIASRAIDQMKLLRIDEETTSNVGSFIAPGSTNVVNDHAVIVLEVRSRSGEKRAAQIKAIEQACKKAATDFGGSCEITLKESYVEYSHPDTLPVLALFKQACARLSLPCITKKSTGGSDANLLNAHGIPTVVIGAGYRYPHGAQEVLYLDELRDLTSLIVELIKG